MVRFQKFVDIENRNKVPFTLYIVFKNVGARQTFPFVGFRLGVAHSYNTFALNQKLRNLNLISSYCFRDHGVHTDRLGL